MKNNAKNQKINTGNKNILLTDLTQQQEQSIKGGWRSTAECVNYRQLRRSGQHSSANQIYNNNWG